MRPLTFLYRIQYSTTFIWCIFGYNAYFWQHLAPEWIYFPIFEHYNISKDGNLWSPLAQLGGGIDICAHWLFYTEFKNKYLYQIFSILAITRVDSQMLISQLYTSSLCRQCYCMTKKNFCRSTSRERAQLAIFHRSSHPICDQLQISFFSRKIIFKVAHFAIHRPVCQPWALPNTRY